MAWSAAIAAGANLLGGFLGSKSSKKAQKRNERLQKEFAQNSIQWRVADAKAAGVHPLYAMGASPVAAQPSYVGDTNMANALANAGQDISRAMTATSSKSTRDNAHMEKVRALTISKMGLENELLASQIAKLRAQTGPPIPTGNDNKHPDLPVGSLNLKLPDGQAASSALEDQHGEATILITAPRFVKTFAKEAVKSGQADVNNYYLPWMKKNLRRWLPKHVPYYGSR